ncbi:hypothetical protein [Aquitalea sp. LB_tupeE]|uniref:hypothetical protein n=1 Tax=Aquitalea sp. LB_tupeE TaxID=2748078 RepID=UPI0015BDEE64|nr:hypothetical protein [Aquitalea sp. LB_tupeE]NWK79022.1 hypothetical protein [Aquitalea sp. LB_tupeE]
MTYLKPVKPPFSPSFSVSCKTNRHNKRHLAVKMPRSARRACRNRDIHTGIPPLPPDAKKPALLRAFAWHITRNYC